MKVVAISGWKRSGKDTFADYLVENNNYVKLSFATILKEMVAEQYNIPLDYLYLNEFKEKPLPQYPVNTVDRFTQVIHELLSGEFREYKVEHGDECEFIKCWTPRALAILEGSIKRSVNSSYWTQKIINDINQRKKSIDDIKYSLAGRPSNGVNISDIDHEEVKVVIPDLRFVSEETQLRDAFGDDLITVRINRFEEIESTDASERDLDNFNKFDIVLDTKNTNLEQYQTLIKETIKRL